MPKPNWTFRAVLTEMERSF